MTMTETAWNDTPPAEPTVAEPTPDVTEGTDAPAESGLDRRDVSTETLAAAVHRVPGAAVETEGDRLNREQVASEPVADTEVPLPKEYDGIDTRTPEANLASRSNIVSDGPGTTGYVGSLGVGPA